VLFPSRVLNGLATGLLPAAAGPAHSLAEQGEKLASKWARPGLNRWRGAGASAGAGEGAAAAHRLARTSPTRGYGLHELHANHQGMIKARSAAGAAGITATGRVLREISTDHDPMLHRGGGPEA